MFIWTDFLFVLVLFVVGSVLLFENIIVQPIDRFWDVIADLFSSHFYQLEEDYSSLIVCIQEDKIFLFLSHFILYSLVRSKTCNRKSSSILCC